MKVPGARQAALLTVLVLLAQTLLTWHMPSHLGDHAPAAETAGHMHDHDADTGASDSCPLGINGHGLALTDSATAGAGCNHLARFTTPYLSHSSLLALIVASARGPPLNA